MDGEEETPSRISLVKFIFSNSNEKTILRNLTGKITVM